ncbi:hypothetical protein B0A48_06694 [Cryoendolithus antarcticus]|uniref:Uncharacterized protein n=1 Tax=Cryoendolithus antarcticus TaxID=1507870 RepID=A0A1V8T9N7_9PEZI|nr:hypothetical protein B0A48_06694 [Cryoendolithus antarcticus]
MQLWSTHGAQALALRRLQHPTAPASLEAKDHGGNGVHHCPICKGQMNSRAKPRGYCDIHFVLCHSPNHAGQEFQPLKGTKCIKCVEITAAKEAKEAKERKVRREKQVADAIEKWEAEGAKKAGGGGK